MFTLYYDYDAHLFQLPNCQWEPWLFTLALLLFTLVTFSGGTVCTVYILGAVYLFLNTVCATDRALLYV